MPVTQGVAKSGVANFCDYPKGLSANPGDRRDFDERHFDELSSAMLRILSMQSGFGESYHREPLTPGLQECTVT